MLDLSSLVSQFRQFVASHSDTKKLYFARTIGTSPSGLSMILAGTSKPTASQALAMLNIIRGGSTRIVGLQENAGSVAPNGDPNQRIALNDKNINYLENFSRKVDAVFFDSNNAGRVARENAPPSEDPANNGDITDVPQADRTNDPDLENVFRPLNNLYPQIDDVLRQIGNILKAVPNKSGSTEPMRRTTDNADSRKAGPRQPKFSR